MTQQLDAVNTMIMAAEGSSHSCVVKNAAARIMIVDDEPVNAKIVRKHLRGAGYENFIVGTDSVEALDLLRRDRPDVVLLDLLMPDVDGLEFLRRLREDEQQAQTPVIILTATDDRTLKQAALELGAMDFLQKPVDPLDLVLRVRNTLAVKAYQDQLRGHAQKLERQVRQRTAELEASRLELVHCLGRAAEYRDNETGRHVIRVGRFVGVIGRALSLDEDTISLLEQAAPLHDMGKIGIPDSILLKPGRLDAEELAIMRKHTEYGRDIVSFMDDDAWSRFATHALASASCVPAARSPVLKVAATIALTHHEKWDGSGYPLGLKGEEIPLSGRITAVADVFDALGSKRPYKPAFSPEKCFSIIAEGRGAHFDPRVVDAFLACREEIVQISLQFADEA